MTDGAGSVATSDIDIAYRPRDRIGGLRVGAHASRVVGAFGAFRDEVPFTAHPDARRIDVRASLRDPFETIYVRRFHQRAAIDVVALVDLTGSLAYEGRARKHDLVASFCGTLARSATRIGDRFALYGCDDKLREDCLIPPSRRRGLEAEVVATLQRATCRGASAEGLVAAADGLVGARKMVFVVSDFLWPSELLQRLFERLSRHDVVPVRVVDSSEDAALPSFGLMEVADLETGRSRLVFMRASLRKRWLDAARAREAELTRVALSNGRAPITIRDALDSEALSRQMLEG